MKCKDCTITSCPNRGSNAVFSKPCTIINQDSFDWKSFRAEAKKDILCAIIGDVMQTNNGAELIGQTIECSVIIADKLIAKLKEKEEK